VRGGMRVPPRIPAPVPVAVAAATAPAPAAPAADLLKPLSEVPPASVEGTQPNPAVRRPNAQANGEAKPAEKKN
jgi:hypothetical protein